MKQIFLALAATAFLATAAYKTQAQLALNLEVPTEVKTNTSEASVNLKAISNFQKSFLNAANVSWVTVKDGYVAHFQNNGIATQVGYSNKGKMNYEILRYTEANIPADIKARVSSAYEEYDITGADEVHLEDQVIYLVHIEGKRSFKIIRINDDEMSVYEDLKKAM